MITQKEQVNELNIGFLSDNKPVIIQVFKERIFDEEQSVYEGYKIKIGNSQIHIDSTSLIYFSDSLLDMLSYKSTNYIMIRNWNPVSSDEFEILQIENGKIKKRLRTYDQIVEDIDSDGKIEIGGFKILEGYCNDCDSMYYTPYDLYELGDMIIYDSIASELITLEVNGVFYNDSKRRIIPKP